ncbi:MAG: hypothetical protein ACI35P_06595 [Bacillus sp. (in: firmicutes)]
MKYRITKRFVEVELVGGGELEVIQLLAEQDGGVVEVGSIEIVDLEFVHKVVDKQRDAKFNKRLLLAMWAEFQNRLVRFYEASVAYMKVAEHYGGFSRVLHMEGSVKGLVDPSAVVAADFRLFLQDIESSGLLWEALRMCRALQLHPEEEYRLDERIFLKEMEGRGKQDSSEQGNGWSLV